MKFGSTNYRSAIAACDRIAGQITRAAEAMGLEARRDKSAVSASEYVLVRLADEDETVVKVRVSDHGDRHGGADYRVYCDARAGGVTGDGSWLDCVAWIAERAGKPLPASVRAARTKAAAVAAEMARANAEIGAHLAAMTAESERREAARIAWNPARWAEIAEIPGKKGRVKRRAYRRQADAALGFGG